MATDYTSLLSRLSGLGSEDNPILAFRGARQLVEDQRAMANYANDPQAATDALSKIDPITGAQLQAQRAAAAKTAQDAQDEQNKKKQGIFGNIVATLRGVDPSQYDSTLQAMAPALANAGYSADDISNAAAAIKANPHLVLSTDPEAYKASVQPHVVTPGSILTQGSTEVLRAPYAPKAIPQGSPATGYAISTFDPNTGAVNAGPAGQGPQSPHEGGLNNPGNIRWDGKSQWPGMDPNTKPGDIINFATQADGDHAGITNIQNQQKLHGINTLAALISKYAPPSENNTGAYIQAAAQRLGINPNAPLNLSDPNIAAKVYHLGIVPQEGNTHSGPLNVANGPVATVGAKPAATYRPATPEELSAYPGIQSAQIGSDGKLYNVVKAAAGKGGKAADPVMGLNSSLQALDELRSNLSSIASDPNLSKISGLSGHLLQYTPSGEDIKAKLGKVNAQKLVAIAQSLQAAGNPFSRVTNMEAQQLPKTLANIQPGMSLGAMKDQVSQALAQLAQSRANIVNEGIRQGLIAVGKGGKMVMFNGRGWVPFK